MLQMKLPLINSDKSLSAIAMKNQIINISKHF